MITLLAFLVFSVVHAEPTSTDPPKDILSAKEIYALLDAKKWEKGIIAAQVLVATQPNSALAYLTLGDALAHYPDGDGDIYLAFDAWMKTKELSPSNSSMWKTAKERLGWSLERSGIVKFTPNSSTGQKGWSKDFAYTLQTSRDLDLTLRTDFMLGGVYITNIPTGDVILEVTPSAHLPTIVQKYSITSGELRKIYIPTDAEELQKAIDRGEYLLKDAGGTEMLDKFIQSSLQTENSLYQQFESKSFNIPKVDIPQNCSVYFIDKNGIRTTYADAVEHPLSGGKYLVQVDKKGTQSFGDLIIHPNITEQSVQNVIANDASRRNYESLSAEDVAKVGELPKLTVDVPIKVETAQTVSPGELVRVERMQKFLLVGFGLTTTYAITANLLARQFVDTANTEQTSQQAFDDAYSSSELWRTQFNVGAFLAGQMAMGYLTTKLLTTSLVEDKDKITPPSSKFVDDALEAQ